MLIALNKKIMIQCNIYLPILADLVHIFATIADVDSEHQEVFSAMGDLVAEKARGAFRRDLL